MSEWVHATTPSSVSPGWVLVADERAATGSALAPILDAIARLDLGFRQVPSMERALGLLRDGPIAAVVRAGPDGAGSILATELLRLVPDLPLVLHGRELGPLRGVVAARPSACALLESTVASSLAPVLPALIEARWTRRDLLSRLSCASGGREAVEALPPSFHLDGFLGDLEATMLLAAYRWHGSIAKAAKALGMAERLARRHMPSTFVRRLPGDLVPPGPFLAWIASVEPAPSTVAVCEALGVSVRRLEPGYSARRNPADESILAAIVDPEQKNASALVDASVIQRIDPRLPVVLCGNWAAPTLSLAERLGLGFPADPVDIDGLLPEVARLGRAAAMLRAVTADTTAPEHLPEDAESHRVPWFLDLPRLLQKVEDELLELSDRTHDGGATAAAALGLARSTYYFRLERARRRHRPGLSKALHDEGPRA